MAHLVDVVLPLPLHKRFTYRVNARSKPRPGTRVLVPFRNSERVGWVLEPSDPDNEPHEVRDVLEVLDDEPAIPKDLLRLGLWMAEYYAAPEGIVLRTLLPSVLSDPSREYVRLAAEWPGTDGPAGLTRREIRLMEAVARRPGPVRVSALRRTLAMGSLWPEVRSLRDRGLLHHETLPPKDPPVKTRKAVRVERWLEDLSERDDLFRGAPRQGECYRLLESAGGEKLLSELMERGGFSRSVVRGLEAKGVVAVVEREETQDPFTGPAEEGEVRLTPNPHQSAALERLRAALDEDRPRTHLLYGVTGSGKTLVYLELLEQVVLARGRSAVVLVPEIALTPQTVRRFRARFGDRVAVLHSGLSQGERYDQWRRLRSGEKRIAVGPRSAAFAPLTDLGAIVVDEEHDGSYKQSEAPRYQARDVAVMRASMAGALCVLGTATPALETWANVEAGKFVRLDLPERVTGKGAPPVEVVDLRRSPEEAGVRGGTGGGKGDRVLSSRMVEAVQDRLDRGEQAILLLNRRGFSSFVQCRECGDVVQCPHCSVSLTYHRTRGRLLCHHCRHEAEAPRRCRECGSQDLSYRGLGTEQVERVVAETFPRARIARMDVDTTSGKWAHDRILGRVDRGEVDILLGTQMIAKGLDFPRVTLVGVVNADVGIHLPDFRSSERTFQLLSQVAGRTGRGPLGGSVLVQTSIPEHYTIQAVVDHDYEGFAARELRERKSPAYPPHVRLANVVVSSPDQERAADAAEEAARWVRLRSESAGGEELEVVGPAPAPIERLHGRWRWHFFLRGPSPGVLGRVCRAFAREFRPSAGGDVRLLLDRDPSALL